MRWWLLFLDFEGLDCAMALSKFEVTTEVVPETDFADLGEIEVALASPSCRTAPGLARISTAR